MDPPEETPAPAHHKYSLGDAGRLEHVAQYRTSDDVLLAVARLGPDDPCFVLRTGGVFTFARVLKRTHGPDAELQLLVDDDGSTKDVPLRQCPKYVRPLRPEVEKYQRRNSSASNSSSTSKKWKPKKKPDPKDKEESKRPGLKKSSGASKSTRYLGRRSSADDVAANGIPQQPRRRPALKRAQSTMLHTSFQSGLKDLGPRPAGGGDERRSKSLNESVLCGDTPVPDREHEEGDELPKSKIWSKKGSSGSADEQHQRSLRSSFVRASSARRLSRRGSSDLHSSIMTINRPESRRRSSMLASDVDDILELSSADSKLSSVASDPEVSNPGEDTDSITSDEEESPRAPKELHEKGLNDSIKKVRLPGFDDIEFNEESLLAAFGQIGVSAKVN